MATSSILVLGGKGKTGSRVASQLQPRGVSVRAASRNGSTRFDWDDEGTWAPALDGADAVYLVDSQGPDAAQTLGEFSELAVARGTSRLVLLSARDAANSAKDELPASERAVRDSGGDWTILRPSWFAQNFSEIPFLRDAVLSGEVVLPAGDGREPFIDADDIAAVAVALLIGDGHVGQTYELTGPRLLSFGMAVEEIAKATGRNLRYVAAAEDAFAAHAVERGESLEFAETVNTDEPSTAC